MEQWTTITNAKKYEISSLGNIRNKKTKKNRKFYYHLGYAKIKLVGNNGKILSFRVNRLVAESFICKLKQGDVVDHLDRNRINNSIDNLRVVDTSINSKNKYIKNLSSIERIIQLYRNGMSAEEIKNVL